MRIVTYISFLMLLIGFSSCEKVITIDLNKTSPQLVIDAHITDQPGPYTVKLSQSTDFFTPGAYPVVSGATVIITDNGGIAETLTETTPGTYQTSKLQGIPGHTYVLNITSAGKTYVAQSSMPQPVDIDSLSYDTLVTGGRFGGGGGRQNGGRARINLHGYFTDPVGIVNYYSMHFYRNDSLLDSSRYVIYSDNLVDGKQADINYRSGIRHGNNYTMELLSIDKATYDFYRTANDILDKGDQLTSAAPSNPITNVSAGAVGYFSAYCTRKKSMYIP